MLFNGAENAAIVVQNNRLDAYWQDRINGCPAFFACKIVIDTMNAI